MAVLRETDRYLPISSRLGVCIILLSIAAHVHACSQAPRGLCDAVPWSQWGDRGGGANASQEGVASAGQWVGDVPPLPILVSQLLY